MSRKLYFVGVVLCLLTAAPWLVSQEWVKPLVQQQPQHQLQRQLNFKDYQSAFELYYKEHPVDLSKENLKPTFAFQSEVAQKNRVNIESLKLFKRWEWLMQPRTYPSGVLDYEKIDALSKHVEAEDNRLILLQREPNPLKLQFEEHRIIWPHFKFWHPLGPSDAVGNTNLGRVNSIQFDPTNSNIIYIGTPDGGVWKTTDGGATWSPKFDTQPTLSTGDVAIDPANPNVLFVATSDPFGYGTPFWGGTYSVGVSKSTDGGNTWTATGLTWTVGQNRTVRRLVIHPSNGNILLAATSDGLYRTADAAATWTKIVPASAYDADFDPTNGNIVYVTTNQVLKSTDAGVTFTATSASCAGSRYSVKVARSSPKTLYTLCTNGVVQKSTNAGANWTTTTSPGVTLYGYYDNVLAVSPVNPKNVYVAGFNIKHTTDGGTSWSSVGPAGHVDNHALRFLPGSDTTLFAGDDGGLFKTTNAGSTWTSLNKGLEITQYYGLGIARTDPNIMEAGAQDNGNMKYNAGTWTNITNADGMRGFIDWSNASVIYASIQYGGLYRSTDGGSTFTGISTPSSGSWVTPWMQDPTVANTMYAGTDKVYKSTNQGTTWTAISPALSGIGSFEVLAVAQASSSVIYAGSGTRLYRTRNAGATWIDISAGLPVATNYLTGIAIHDYDPSIVYVTFSGYDAGKKVYKSCDSGATWTNISGTLPNIPVDSIVHEKKYNNPLYVGTDAGVYYLNDDLTDWIPYKFGLPNVIVDWLEIHYNTGVIRAASYGRGVWQAPLN